MIDDFHNVMNCTINLFFSCLQQGMAEVMGMKGLPFDKLWFSLLEAFDYISILSFCMKELSVCVRGEAQAC